MNLLQGVKRVFQVPAATFAALSLFVVCFLFPGCDLIRMKKGQPEVESARKPVARVNTTYLFRDELVGIATSERTPWWQWTTTVNNSESRPSQRCRPATWKHWIGRASGRKGGGH